MGNIAALANPLDDLPIVWQSSLVLDIAMGTDEDIICEAYELQYPQLQAIKNDPAFMARLKKAADDLNKEGATFRLKAQMQAEALLQTSFAMIHSDEIDPKVRAKLISDTVRWAGYDNAAAAGAETGPGISIHIDLGAADKAVAGRVFENGD